MRDQFPDLFEGGAPGTGRFDPIIFDSFAGGGGATTGFELAGFKVDYAINHCDAAIAMHKANHPETKHLLSDVWALHLLSHTMGRQVLSMWASPDCTQFSRAKGGRPKCNKRRGLAWVVVEYCQKLGNNRPLVIFLENVEEFLGWEDFDQFTAALKKLGYKIEWKVLRACDYGAPTIRKRLFMVMRRDGKKIRWPFPTHGDPDSDEVKSGALKPWPTAADIIDWSKPAPSIFLTKEEGRKFNVKRPLVENSQRRIAEGLKRYVLESPKPFIVNYSHGGKYEPIDEPVRTIMTERGGSRAVVVPFVERHFSQSKGASAMAPVGAITAGGGGHTGLVSAYIAQHNLGVIGRSADAPLSTVTTTGAQQAVVASVLTSLKGTSEAHIKSCSSPVDQPVRSITAGGRHLTEMRAFLIKYYGEGGQWQGCGEPLHTIPTKDRFALTQVETIAQCEEERYCAWWVARWYEKYMGEPKGVFPWECVRPSALMVGDYAVKDIGSRMFDERELFRAQGFPDDYEIDVEHNGKKLTKAQVIEKCGNSVSPLPAAALISANLGEYQ